MNGKQYQKQGNALVETTPKVVALRQYELCEIYYFLNPALRPGFVQAAGGLINNAATLHPAAFQFLQTTEGQAMCVTESEWQALSTATYYTNASGVAEGWNGVGGVAKFVIDTANGTIRVPDLRGMYAEAAGLDSLAVGGVHADRARNITGKVYASDTNGVMCYYMLGNHEGAFTGVFGPLSRQLDSSSVASSQQTKGFQINASRIIPTGSYNVPRAFGALACVYLGA